MNILTQSSLTADVRATSDGRYSVYDLLRKAKVKGEREVFRRLTEANPELITICDAVKLGAGRAAKNTPVTDRAGWLQILALLPGAVGAAYRKESAELVIKVWDGDADLGAELIIRDHNKDRVERAKKRVLVSGTNKETMELAAVDGANYATVHNDRYRGLYQKSAKQLREDAGLEKGQTPLDKMSAYDLNLNSLANQMALMAGSSAKVLEAGNLLRQTHRQVVGGDLVPTWEDKLLRPSQAKRIAYAPEYQLEMPILNA
jgi:hypothetical protein